MNYQNREESRNRWDKYFMDICKVVASNSKCLSRQIGAILIKDKSIVSTGYNGAPRGLPHCGEERNKTDMNLFGLLRDGIDPILGDHTMCPRQRLGYHSGEGLHLCPAAHAEVNCIANAARIGVAVLGTTMYMTCGRPCANCLAIIINAGVAELVCASIEEYDETSKFIAGNITWLKIRTTECQ